MTHQQQMYHHQSRRRQQRKHQDVHPDDRSEDSLELTLSLSSPSPDGEVSWSSSEGSSYDTAEDLANLHLQRKKTSHIKISKLDVKRTSTEKIQIRSQNISRNKPSTVENRFGTKNTEILSKNPKSRLLRPFAKTDPCTSHSTTKGLIYDSGTSLKKKTNKACPLKNVDVYTEVALASGKEDLSTVCFLSKEETDQVFIKRNVPVAIAAAKNDCIDEMSIISASVNGSTMSLSGYDNCDDFSQKAVHKIALSGRETLERDVSDCNSRVKPSARPRVELCEVESVHSVAIVSVSCQRTVSSLGFSPTWDSQEDCNSFEGNGSEDAVRGQLKADEYSNPADADSHAKETPLNEKHLFVANTTLKVERASDMDDRIVRLKEKIRNMQKTSLLETEVADGIGESAMPLGGADSISMESTVSGLHTEAVSTLADLPGACSRRLENGPTSNHAVTGEKWLPSSRPGGRQPLSSSKIPSVIPIDRLEDISLMDCDIESQRDRGFQDVPLEGKSDKSAEFMSRVQAATDAVLTTVKGSAGYLLIFIRNQRVAFEAKSRNEKAVAIFIASSILILFILIIALIA